MGGDAAHGHLTAPEGPKTAFLTPPTRFFTLFCTFLLTFFPRHSILLYDSGDEAAEPRGRLGGDGRCEACNFIILDRKRPTPLCRRL
jgi:hypothetical protein